MHKCKRINKKWKDNTTRLKEVNTFLSLKNGQNWQTFDIEIISKLSYSEQKPIVEAQQRAKWLGIAKAMSSSIHFEAMPTKTPLMPSVQVS